MGNLGHNLAGKLFNLSRRGSKFTPAEFAAARRLYEGGSSKADLETVSQALGISKSGARQARREMRGITRGVGMAKDVAYAWDQMSRGNVFSGVAGMLSTGMEAARSMTESRKFKEVLEGAAERYFKDPAKGTRLFYAMGRVARVTGGLAAAASAGWSAGTGIFNYWEERNRVHERRLGVNADLAREYGLDYGTLREQAAFARRVTRKRSWLATELENEGNWFGINMGVAEKEIELRKLMAKVAAGARDRAMKGEDRFAIGAAQTMNDWRLTEYQKRERLSQNIDRKADPRWVMRNDPRMETEMALRSPWIWRKTYSEQEKLQIAAELVQRDLQQAELQRNGLIQADQKREAAMLEMGIIRPEDLRARQEASDIVDAFWGAKRRSHQAWAGD